MDTTKLPEVWMRGPVDGIPALLQPVAHALLQAREEVNEMMVDFPATLLWQKPAGIASVGFHLQHLTGVVSRLFTYADGKVLAPVQMDALDAEGIPAQNLNAVKLLSEFELQVDKAIEHLKHIPENALTEPRGIGRKQIPTTVIGLLFHAAEHTMRHTGQLSVTVRILKAAS